MFGFPTGIGALLVRRSRSERSFTLLFVFVFCVFCLNFFLNFTHTHTHTYAFFPLPFPMINTHYTQHTHTHIPSLPTLARKQFFGGGTLQAYSATHDFMLPRSEATRFEDGTVSFLSIIQLEAGFDMLARLTMAHISDHTFALACHFRQRLLSLTHYNGAPVGMIYSPEASFTSSATHGPVVTFNLKRADGSWVGYAEVAKLAGLHDIDIRTGLCDLVF